MERLYHNILTIKTDRDSTYIRFHRKDMKFCATREISPHAPAIHSKIFISKYILPVSEIGYELHNTMLITCIYRFAWQVTAVPNLRHDVTVHKMIYRVIYVTRGGSSRLRDPHGEQFRLDATFVRVESKVSLDGRQVSSSVSQCTRFAGK